MSDDLVTRLRALADTPHPTPQIQRALREAADTFVSVFKAWEEERDALKSKLAEEYGRSESALCKVEKERDEARAEAAAYRHVLKIALGCIDIAENRATAKAICEVLSQPGPGSALLERVKKLEALAAVAKRDAGRDGPGVTWEMTEALRDLEKTK